MAPPMLSRSRPIDLSRIVWERRLATQDLHPDNVLSVLDAVIRVDWRSEPVTQSQRRREWALVDTRNLNPGDFIVRCWVGSRGPEHRSTWATMGHGGAFGCPRCASIGPCPHAVDDGVGLLLLGFETLVVIPLPQSAADELPSNWLAVLCEAPDDFSGVWEVESLLVAVWAALLPLKTGDAASSRCPPVPAGHVQSERYLG